MRPRLLILGRGRLGRAVELASPSYEVSCVTLPARSLLACTGDSWVKRLSIILGKNKITHVFNTAAMTDVEACNDRSKQAFESNSQLPSALSVLCQRMNIHFTHISTDQVYSGAGLSSESDTAPLNIYGLSKLSGDRVAHHNNALVLRTNYLGRSDVEGRLSLSDWAVGAYKHREQISLFDNIYFNPVSKAHLVRFLLSSLTLNITGIYNLGSKTGISKGLLISNLMSILELDNPNARFSSYNFEDSNKGPFVALRPLDMRMGIEKTIADFAYWSPPTIEQTIEEIAEEYVC